MHNFTPPKLDVHLEISNTPKAFDLHLRDQMLFACSGKKISKAVVIKINYFEKYRYLKVYVLMQAVAAHNLSQLRNLCAQSRVEMSRQEVRAKLDEVDTEVKESYSRYF